MSIAQDTRKLARALLFGVFATAILLLNSCSKDSPAPPGPGTFSSDVALKWTDMQLKLFRTNATITGTPIGGLPPQRYNAYINIAFYESIVQGTPNYQSLSGQLTDMPAMPKIVSGSSYYWPACVNAAMAAMTRNFFPGTSDANKATMDSLENTLNSDYQAAVNSDEFQRSVSFGQSIAAAIFSWSKADSAKNANAAYTPPVGPGIWAPTPPAYAVPFGPYWGKDRLMVQGSLSGSDPLAPPTYSTDPASDYYSMVKEVYDVSQNLTTEQKNIGLYFRDNPGFGGGHYLFILRDILAKENKTLDYTAYALALSSIAFYDAAIGCWKAKYTYNQERPIRYIRETMSHSTWNPLFATPAFPDFPSGHSTIAGAFAEVLNSLFGANYQFEDHSYDYLGMAFRTYSSPDAFPAEVSNARVYAGIHYRISCDRGVTLGRKVGLNVIGTLKFKK